jgi:hypothetical protein
MGPLIAILGVVIIAVVAVLGYAAAGYAYAQGRLNTAKTTYNAVIDHEKKYADAMDSLAGAVNKVDLNTATTAELQQTKTTVSQFVDSAQQTKTQIQADDTSLAGASSDLQQNQWLTAIDKSEIDKALTRIGHLRKAMADAKVVIDDYAQDGAFFLSLYDVLIDFDSIGTQSGATAFNAALSKLKTDATKATSLDKAPGLPAEFDAFLKDVQKLADDLAAYLAAVTIGDQAAADAAKAAGDTDAAKVDAHDLSKMYTQMGTFYQPMIDDFNSEIQKANNT